MFSDHADSVVLHIVEEHGFTVSLSNFGVNHADDCSDCRFKTGTGPGDHGAAEIESVATLHEINT
jgi:hypothetical protein